MLIIFNAKNGSLVVDDELVVSQASEVEYKVLSDRKNGKNGPFVDCLADSQIF